MNILEIKEVSKVFSNKGSQTLNVINNVSFSIQRGLTLALTGESGSGKSTLARMIMRLESLTSGKILMDCQGVKKDITHIAPREYYGRVQMIFQDPWSSLNPSRKIWQIISAPLAARSSLDKNELFAIAETYILLVGLGREYLHAYPRALSGGQRQRVGIARSLVLKPDLLILDEALSALDLSIQAQIINLLIDLQAALELTYLFISHDMNMIEHFADQVAVMDAGNITMECVV